MQTLYKAWGLAGLLLTATTLGATAQTRLGLRAQLAAGTYTDLGTAGTVIATADADDASSTAQDIGFTFTYGGVAFTQFVLNTNGLLRLGATAPSLPAAHSGYAQNPDGGPINSVNDTNLLMPFNFDLEAGTGTPEYRVATTGSAGSRVCTIQWKNVSDKALAVDPSDNSVIDKQYANFSFQVKLYEGSSQVEFVYGPATANASAKDDLKYATVGIKGAYNTVTNDLLLTKNSRDAWNTSTTASGQQLPALLDNAFNFRSSALPTAGLTVRFTTCTPNTITNFPYTENFDNANASQLTCSSASDDSNKDGFPWSVAFPDVDGIESPALTYLYNYADSSVPADDWYYTPGLVLRAGYRYQLQFKYRAGNGGYPEGMEVNYGSAATPTGQTTMLFQNLNIANTDYLTTTATQVPTIAPATTGTYYIGFHAVSDADNYLLFLDDIQVTETQILGVHNATNSVFTAEASPVPFGESLNLTINTTKPGPARLTLRDALGRTLRQSTTASVAGSSTVAVPEVGSLPGGVYFLTVEQGGQSQVLRVVK